MADDIQYEIGAAVPLDFPRKIVGREMDAPEWYILRTVPQREFAAQAWLQHFGVLTWLPTETRWRKVPRGRRDKAQYQHRIAPGYLFCQFHRAPHWDVIRDKGRGKVSGVVSHGEWPLVIPEEAIAKMRMVPEHIEIQRRAAAEARRISVGDRVEIIAGPLAGWTVDVARIDAGIAHFIIPLLGESVGSVSVENVEKVAT